jgi:BMFP domain-containing protein YqiC
MSPEDVAAPAPAPEAAPAPAPATSAPAPAPAPSPPAPSAPPPSPTSPPSPEVPAHAAADPDADARTVPPAGMWQHMSDLMRGKRPPLVDRDGEPAPAAGAAPPAAPAPAAPVPAAPAVGAAPEGPPPKVWAGHYKTPEELEAAFNRANIERARAADHAARLERILMASMGQQTAPQGQPAAPGMPPPLSPPGMPPQMADLAKSAAEIQQVIREEHERLALGDPQADPFRLLRANAAAAQIDEATRRVYTAMALREFEAKADTDRQIDAVKQAFFTQFPDLQRAEPDLLRQVAVREERRLASMRDDYGSPEFMAQWFDATATVARQHLRLGDGQVAVPQPPAPTGAPAVSRPPRSAQGAAPFSESPAPRPTEPVLTGQDVYLARVFGPRP